MSGHGGGVTKAGESNTKETLAKQHKSGYFASTRYKD